MTPDERIFVFGSNLAGRHGKGAALFAAKHYGAVYGIGHGRTGNAYAIPTKDYALRTLPLPMIEYFCGVFIRYARDNPGLSFRLTPIGCGLAGYTVRQIAPFFDSLPMNVALPYEFYHGPFDASLKRSGA